MDSAKKGLANPWPCLAWLPQNYENTPNWGLNEHSGINLTISIQTSATWNSQRGSLSRQRDRSGMGTPCSEQLNALARCRALVWTQTVASRRRHKAKRSQTQTLSTTQLLYLWCTQPGPSCSKPEKDVQPQDTIKSQKIKNNIPLSWF